jgi:Mrp family chromosome partitioning ATPase/capsular polysaccharide biosynthesis protein
MACRSQKSWQYRPSVHGTMLEAVDRKGQIGMEEQTFALRDVLRVLRRHRAQILAMIVLAVLAALVISFAQPKRYTAESQLLLGPAVPDAALPDSRGTSKAGPLGLDLPAETQARVVASPLMASRVARSLRISPDQKTIEELTKSVQVKAVTDNVLLITANAPTSLGAAGLANRFAAEFLAYREELATNALGTLAQDYRGRADDLEREAARLDAQIADATARGAGREAAQLTSKRNNLLDQANQRIRQSEALSAQQTADLGVGAVIAPATPPTSSSSPLPLRNVLIAIVLGGAVGVSVALLREHTNDRVQTRDDAARVTGVPVLVAIPRTRGLRSFGGGHWLPRPGGRPRRNELVTSRLPESAASEAYRELRSTLARRGLGTRVKRLLVTSVGAGPEVSETVANLAVVCARSGLLTMAVSADLRRPQLHSYFGISDTAGLAGALDDDSGEATDHPNAPPAALPLGLSVVEIPNLLVLPSGRVDSSPGDLLASAPLGKIFGMATDIAQIVIIEAPPVLSGGDVLTLAAHVDATLLVVRAGIDKESLAARAAAALDAAACPPMGIVLHHVRRSDDTVGAIDERRGDWAQGPAVVDLTANWKRPRAGQRERAEAGRSARTSAAEPGTDGD